ncbi:hypothetical protein FH966_00630 [Lentibacillus cibarius]|uniref:Helix-turn-helix domain-containing protein n=1 Tax=Lentibacillus cibarius TaxID=2583219 RepID=A0A549YEP3_9BACI|nr:hypothetical protein [Lentibacillus cibarius]TRM10342.1 hypothetical protein FH966_00630 [Lentibacillus cibarius]
MTGKELRLIRCLRRATMADVASLIDRYPAIVANIEAGKRNLTKEETDVIRYHFEIDDVLMAYIRKTIELAEQ